MPDQLIQIMQLGRQGLRPRPRRPRPRRPGARWPGPARLRMPPGRGFAGIPRLTLGFTPPARPRFLTTGFLFALIRFALIRGRVVLVALVDTRRYLPARFILRR